LVISAGDYRSKNHKEVMLPSGASFLIRKLTQRDYFPKGLIAMAIERGEVTEASARQYLASHPEDISEVEDLQLLKGVVLPKLTADPESADAGKLYVGDLSGEDRVALVQAIQEWSGLLVGQQAQVDTFRDQGVDGAGTDGEVLRETAGRTT